VEVGVLPTGLAALPQVVEGPAGQGQRRGVGQRGRRGSCRWLSKVQLAAAVQRDSRSPPDNVPPPLSINSPPVHRDRDRRQEVAGSAPNRPVPRGREVGQGARCGTCSRSCRRAGSPTRSCCSWGNSRELAQAEAVVARPAVVVCRGRSRRRHWQAEFDVMPTVAIGPQPVVAQAARGPNRAVPNESPSILQPASRHRYSPAKPKNGWGCRNWPYRSPWCCWGRCWTSRDCCCRPGAVLASRGNGTSVPPELRSV